MILFIGDRPSKRMPAGARAFEGAACEPRLKQWIDELGCAGSCTIVNSTDIEIVAYLTLSLIKRIPIVALGNNASDHLNRMNCNHFKLPHPSGRNRQINDKAFIERRLAECSRYIQSFS